MIETALVLVAVAAIVAAYKYGEREGIRRGTDRLADALRDRVRAEIIEPWLKTFKRTFISNANSYIVDEDALADCAGVAQRLLALRRLLPSVIVHRVWTLDAYVTTSQGAFFPGSSIDPHFGQPTGYVDAFVEIIESNDGIVPQCVWLNKETGDLADYFEDDEGPGEPYERIRLGTTR